MQILINTNIVWTKLSSHQKFCSIIPQHQWILSKLYHFENFLDMDMYNNLTEATKRQYQSIASLLGSRLSEKKSIVLPSYMSKLNLTYYKGLTHNFCKCKASSTPKYGGAIQKLFCISNSDRGSRWKWDGQQHWDGQEIESWTLSSSYLHQNFGLHRICKGWYNSSAIVNFSILGPASWRNKQRKNAKKTLESRQSLLFYKLSPFTKSVFWD